MIRLILVAGARLNFMKIAPLIPFDEIVNVTRASFAAVEAARSGRVVAALAQEQVLG